MTRKNLAKYIQEHWEEKRVSITKASQEMEHSRPLVKSDREVYNFDAVCEELFQGKDKPSSADGILIRGRDIDLIEFKSGFRQLITKKTFKEDKCLCDKLDPPRYCENYGKLFLKNQEKIKAELIDSLKLKAVESYVLLERHILPQCEEMEQAKSFRINYVIVVDANGEDGIEDIMTDLAGKAPSTDNDLGAIKQALKRFEHRTDVHGQSYLYDSVKVLTAKAFKSYIENT